MNKVESFTLDHTKVKAPFVRKCKTFGSAETMIVSKFDIRFTQPNGGDYLGLAERHTMEHILATEFVSAPWQSIDVSAMACGTGFYWSVIGDPSEQEITDYLRQVLLRVQSCTEVPGNSEKECGNYKCHDLKGALGRFRDFSLHLGEGYYK